MKLPPPNVGDKLPLFYEVDGDDLALAARTDVLWQELFKHFDYRLFVDVSARYYELLWLFNEERGNRRQQTSPPSPNAETKDEATQRLLIGRATLTDAPILFDPEPVDVTLDHVVPSELKPGSVPFRIRGRRPKCFFGMFKAFIAMAVRGLPPEPEVVFDEMISNPAFVRRCGFTVATFDIYGEELDPEPTDFPGLRKLQQFDQIMTDNGLWGEASFTRIKKNFALGIIKPEDTLVHDTTHYYAYSGMRVVEVPEEYRKRKRDKKKSHPKTTKNCRCKDRDTCPHPWISADDGAGTVVKSTGKMYWAHKASTIGFPSQGVLLDAAAMTDAASHDSNSVVPHLKRVMRLYPKLDEIVMRVLDDGAADDKALKDEVAKDFGIDLRTSMNPRARKPIKNDLARGIKHITSAGTPVCNAGFEFDFLGCRRESEHFIFRAPRNAEQEFVCVECKLKPGCYRGAEGARTITVPFDRLPWIDTNLPQLSRRHKKIMKKRTAIERMHKLMKFDYGDDSLSKRGSAAFQARLDKTMLAMHMVIAMP